jgi:hypothetical protein
MSASQNVITKYLPHYKPLLSTHRCDSYYFFKGKEDEAQRSQQLAQGHLPGKWGLRSVWFENWYLFHQVQESYKINPEDQKPLREWEVLMTVLCMVQWSTL